MSQWPPKSDEDFHDIKATIQPMLESMAVAELAQSVLILNNVANKTAFRSMLYWRDADVLITTARAVPLRRNKTDIDIQGLLLLFVLLQLHRISCISFNNRVLLYKVVIIRTRCGWVVTSQVLILNPGGGGGQPVKVWHANCQQTVANVCYMTFSSAVHGNRIVAM